MLETYDSVCLSQHPLSMPNIPFSVLVLCDNNIERGRMAEICDELLNAGCMYFAAIGWNHQMWHCAFDKANLRFSPDLVEEKTITTISCRDLEYESIEEWVLISSHPCVDITHGVILYENDDQLYKADCYFRQAHHEVSIEIDWP